MKNTEKIFKNSRGGILPVLTIIVVILGLIIIFSGTISKEKLGGQKSPKENNSPQSKLSSAHMVFYGEWTENGTVIKSYDLSNGTQYKVAELPKNIKKVSLLSPDQILFINKTDERDHGTEMAVYSLSDKKIKPLVSADSGFGIDDYMLSPNKKYLSLWEVQFGQNPPVLLGGKSKVTSVNLDDPKKKYLIESQDATDNNPIFYPKAVTDSGRIFMDRFLPNSGAGWAYGMRISDFTGIEKKDLDNMQNGTYSTQPMLSPDGKNLAFAGYDGSRGSGAEVVNGFRRALVFPNTIELLDTNTLKRIKLEVFANTQIYPSVGWDSQQKDVITYTSLGSDNAGVEETYFYNISENKIQKISLNKTNSKSLAQAIKEKVLGESKGSGEQVVAGLGGNTVLSGLPNNSSSAVGNLGQIYASPYETFALYDPVTGEKRILGESDSLKQVIAVVPSSQVGTTSLTKISSIADENSLQLKTFTPSVETKSFLQSRAAQQSGSSSNTIPSCNELRHEQCVTRLPSGALKVMTYQEYTAETGAVIADSRGRNKVGSSLDGAEIGEYTYFRVGRDRGSRKADPTTWTYNRVGNAYVDQYNKCLEKTDISSVKSECLGSPLYIYGKPGISLEVKVLTPISNFTAPYSKESGFQITTLGDGKFEVNGVISRSIDYDYEIAKRKITAPKNGIVVPGVRINEAIISLASNLGLNDQETQDLIAFAKDRFNSPYVYVSFFDQKTSEEMLPLMITPKPDSYLNIVFYFKSLDQKPEVLPEAPRYPAKFQREGLSVVEISEFVDE